MGLPARLDHIASQLRSGDAWVVADVIDSGDVEACANDANLLCGVIRKTIEHLDHAAAAFGAEGRGSWFEEWAQELRDVLASV